MFQKVAVPVIKRSPLLTGVAGLQQTVCQANKDEHATKFVKGALKLKENFQEVISNEVPYQQLTGWQTAAFILTCF